jgi:hypothetical protein
MNISDQAVQEFRETYIVSNTPLYLYKQLRRLQAVQNLASLVSADDLTAGYLERVNAKDRTVDDVATAYAFLVALTHKESQEAFLQLRSLDVSRLEWAAVIRDTYFSKVLPETSLDITIPNLDLPTVRAGTDAPSVSGSTDFPTPQIQGKANL